MRDQITDGERAAALVAANPELAQVLGPTDAAFYAPFGPWQQQIAKVQRQLDRAIAEGQANAALRAMYEAGEQP
jgi:hypothetical protein